MVDGQMKQDNIVAQKNFTFAAFFMPFCLVNPNNCVNKHTQERDQYYKGTRVAREKYTTSFLLNKGCARSFSNNFVHTFFVSINEHQ